MQNVAEIFGSMVFNDEVMKARLPKETYRQLQQTIKDGRRMNSDVAAVVANAMKDWAIEKGATHFTHWFQPMTGITAEKHDSFISPTEDGKVIMEFSGKELIQGEPDASSFPSGGLRATFEARGYTAWDPTSYAFIKDGALCIPTAFCSYGGEALDKKTPLLRSMEPIDRQAVRVLRLFGNDTCKSVRTTVGPEQEYFLIDKDVYDKRKDLIYTGRTLFGCQAAEGSGAGRSLFRCHQAARAGLYERTERGALEAGRVCQDGAQRSRSRAARACPHLHHDEHRDRPQPADDGADAEDRQAVTAWSACCMKNPSRASTAAASTTTGPFPPTTGVNLLEPGSTPDGKRDSSCCSSCAVIKAVDEYQDLLRISVASAGNDHRLGANEAPPAIVSIFLGSELDRRSGSHRERTPPTARRNKSC